MQDQPNPDRPTPPLPGARRPSAVPYIAASLGLLLTPALWNGFPVVFFDTGGYVLRAFERTLEPGRSIFYGLFLEGTSLGWATLWGPVLVQAVMTLWLLHLTLRTLDRPTGPPALALLTVALSVVTGLSWYVSQLMPDILVPLSVLCLWLLGFRRDRLRGWEVAGIAAIALLALLSHMSTMALCIGLVLVTAAARWLDRRFGWGLTPRPLLPAAIVAGSLVLMPVLHLALVGQAVYTPGGSAFIFGRLLQDGVIARLLADRCPADPTAVQPYLLCAHRDGLPTTANDFLWHAESPFRKIGWWAGAQPELARMVRDAVRAYPGQVAGTAVLSTLDQLVRLKTGDGLDEWQEVTRWVVRTRLPVHERAFLSARQQREETTWAQFDALNRIHVPAALAAMAGLVVVLLRGGGDADRRRMAAFAGVLLLALLGNAFISGALSNPHDRYQSRMAWLAVLGVAAALVPRRQDPDRAP